MTWLLRLARVLVPVLGTALWVVLLFMVLNSRRPG